MNYGMSTKATSQIGNYFSKQISKPKAYNHTKGNNTIIAEKEFLKSPMRSVYPGISKGQDTKTKFKTSQNSPERLFKKQDKTKDLRDVSMGKKDSNYCQGIKTKNFLSTTKIQEMIKDSIGFDPLFMKKIQKLQTKNSYSNNHLTHSNYLNNKPNKISLEISQQSSQLYPKNSKHNLSKKDSFFYKKSNSNLEEEDDINKEFSSNNDFNYIKGTQNTAKMTSPRLQSGKGDKMHYTNNKEGNKATCGVQSIQIKDLQYAKSKSNPKTNSTQNINSKSNQQLHAKYSSALLNSTNNNNNAKGLKSSGIVLPLDCIHSKSNKNISADIISKTTCHTKTNSRKQSTEKNVKIFNHNPMIQSLEINNYLFSTKAKSNLISGKGSSSSLIKQQNSNINNNNIDYNSNNVSSHMKRLSEVPNIKLLLNNTLNNGYDLQKSSQFAATSKNFINMNDIKYIEYVTSNIKGSNLNKNTSSLNNKLNKKKEEIEKDLLQAKMNSIQQNKSVTTVQSKQNSKSTSRVEEFSNNLNAKTPKHNNNNNNVSEINNIINDKQSVYNINFIINTNQVPMTNKDSSSGINIMKYSSPVTASQSPVAKSKPEIINNSNINTNPMSKMNQIKEEEATVNNKKKAKAKAKEKMKEKASIVNNTNERMYNQTLESIQSTVRESVYYRNEMEKISNYIRQYYYSNGAYPESKINFYQYGRVIGKGAFGKVNLALHISSGRLVAIKSFNKSKLKNKREKEKIKHEINALKKLQHPFISQILDTFETEKHILIVMEYICGDLLSFIRKRSKISENSSKIIFRQIIEGLDFIHSNKIVHRDIKLDNILIDINNTVKICDFGVSRKLNPGDVMHEHCGTLAYIAPEIFQNNGYEGYTCDIWSAGVTLYYMLSGSLPFKVNNTATFHEKIIGGKYEKLMNISAEARDLIDGMLQIDPKKRLTIQQILYHPWLNEINLKYRGNINMFTNAEKILLRRYDVNYLRSNKEEMVENFTIKNLDTVVEEEKKHGNTKSLILAPYNSYASFIASFSSDDIRIENGLCKFCGKVKQANIKYELNNNEDFDNGVIITQNESLNDNENQPQGVGAGAGHGKSNSNNNSFSKPMSPNVEMNDEINVISGLSSPIGKGKTEINYDLSHQQALVIKENIVREIEANLGYEYNYIISCLKKKEVNYATATYYLLTRDFNDNIAG